jgi:hypothetical protein
MAAFGRAGFGKGAGTLIAYQGVPETVHPVAEIEFPSQDTGGQPVKTRVVLEHRC